MQPVKAMTRVKRTSKFVDTPEKKKRDKSQMPIITSDHKDLFCPPTTEDKLTLFQSLLDAHELTENLSLSLLKIIHQEIKNNRDQSRERSLYKQYAKAIASLSHHKLDLLHHVVNTWKNNQTTFTPPADWFPDDKSE